MAERGFGRVVNIASTAGLKGYPYVCAYCAAKHAVVGFVRALALETAKTGVTVNAVCPGYTDTDLVRESVDAHHARRPAARARRCSPTCSSRQSAGPADAAAGGGCCGARLCSPDAGGLGHRHRRSPSPAERSDVTHLAHNPLDAETKAPSGRTITRPNCGCGCGCSPARP